MKRITVTCVLSCVLIFLALLVSPLAGQSKPNKAAPEQPPTPQLPKKVIIDGWWDIDWAKIACRTTTCGGLTEDEIEREVVAFDRSVMAALAANPTCRGVNVAIDLVAYNRKYGYHLITDNRNAWSLSFNLVLAKMTDSAPSVRSGAVTTTPKGAGVVVLSGAPYWAMASSLSDVVYEGYGGPKEVSDDVCAVVTGGNFGDLGARAVPKTACPRFNVAEAYQVPDGYVRGEDTHGKLWDIPKKNVDEAKKRDPHLMLRDDDPERNSWNVVAYTSNPPRWTVIRTDHKKHNQFRYILSCGYSTWRNEEPSHNECNLPVGATMLPDFVLGPVIDIWEDDLAGERRLTIAMKCSQQRFVILNETVEPLGSK